MAEPFYWPDRDGWYLWVKKPDGKRSRQRLAKTKTKAFEIWKEMSDPGLLQNPTVASIANRWIGHLKNRVATSSVSQEHLNNAQREITNFLNFKSSRLRWNRYTPDLITEYCGAHDWAASTVRKRMALLRELSTYGSKHQGLKDVLVHLVKLGSFLNCKGPRFLAVHL